MSDPIIARRVINPEGLEQIEIVQGNTRLQAARDMQIPVEILLDGEPCYGVPTLQPVEIFTFTPADGGPSWHWNAERAREIAEDGRPVNGLNVASAAAFFDSIITNKEHAERADPKRPVILAEILTDGDGKPLPEPQAFVIDGWHRLWKAQQLGWEEVPCLTLTPEEEESCRVTGVVPSLTETP